MKRIKYKKYVKNVFIHTVVKKLWPMILTGHMAYEQWKLLLFINVIIITKEECALEIIIYSQKTKVFIIWPFTIKFTNPNIVK